METWKDGHAVAKYKPERGTWLTVWIIASAVLSFVALVTMFQVLRTALGFSERTVPAYVTTGLLCMNTLIILQLVFLFGIWRWKRWGVYGISIIAILSPIAESMAGAVTTGDWLAPFIQIGILWWLVRNRWDDFKGPNFF